MGGYSSLPPLNTLDDFEQLMNSGGLPAGAPSQALRDRLPTPPPPQPTVWVDNGAGEPVPPSWMKNPGPDWYRVVFADGTEMSAAEYRAWRAKNGVYAPPTAITPDGRPVSDTKGAPPTPTAPPPSSGTPPSAPSPPPSTPTPPPSPTPKPPTSPPPAPTAPPPTPEEERRKSLQTRTSAEAARKSTIATSWRGVLSPPPIVVGRRKTLLGE